MSAPAAAVKGLPAGAVRLRVPARPEFSAVARSATSALALGRGLDPALADKLCLAVEEAFAALGDVFPDAAVVLCYELSERGLIVELAVRGPADAATDPPAWPDELLRQRLAPLVDELHIDADRRCVRLTRIRH